LQGVKFTFTHTVAACGTVFGVFHGGMLSGFIGHDFQYLSRASFNAAPASGTMAFDDAYRFVPVLSPAMQIKRNPQQDGYSCTDIYGCHPLRFLYIIYYLCRQMNGENILRATEQAGASRGCPGGYLLFVLSSCIFCKDTAY
jgi:hypothetical protein